MDHRSAATDQRHRPQQSEWAPRTRVCVCVFACVHVCNHSLFPVWLSLISPSMELPFNSCILCLSLSPFRVFLQDCPEFDLMFDNAFDQWVAGSAGEKCTFVQVLHHTCQRYSSQRKPEFVNCQSKLLGGKQSPVYANSYTTLVLNPNHPPVFNN